MTTGSRTLAWVLLVGGLLGPAWADDEADAARDWAGLASRLEAGEAGADEVAAFLARWSAWVAGAPEGAPRWVPELGVAVDALRSTVAPGPGRGGVGPDGLAARIGLLPRGGSSAWDEVVRALLLDAVDGDRSGAVDRPEELALVPCEAWLAVDAGVRATWPSGLYVTYGFGAELLWIGDALGIDEGLRAPAAERLRVCALPGAADDDGAPIDPVRMTEALGRLPEVGGPAWHGVVRSMLVGLYDTDDSGDLDAAAEARAVDCDVWRGLDAALVERTGRGLVATHRLDVPGGTGATRLGFEATMGAIVLDALGACGLGEAPPPRRQAPPLPLLAWDTDGSGRLDRAVEVGAVPCHAWVALDEATRAEVGLGAMDAWGLDPRLRWAGEAVGLDGRVRGAVRRALRACGLFD